MRVVACYPRCMSAWLSNLLTIPDWSLYIHEALHRPERMEVLRRADLQYKGCVDTFPVSHLGGIPRGASVTVIDADPEFVKDKLRRFFGKDMSEAFYVLEPAMEELKARSKVYRFEDWDEWIGEFYSEHTGLEMDWDRYRSLLDLNIQNREFRK